MEIGSMLMQLAGGLGLFLFGMKLMGDGLEMAAGSKLRGMIERLTKNKYMGALVGLVVTAVIQSSSATTVMVVGFVNAGLMNLAQAVGVIMVANIGNTVTGVMIAINLTAFGRAGRTSVYRDYPKFLRLCRRTSGVRRGWRYLPPKRDLCDLRPKYRHLRHRADFQRGHQQDGEKNRGGSLNVQCVWRNPVYRHQYAVSLCGAGSKNRPGQRDGPNFYCPCDF